MNLCLVSLFVLLNTLMAISQQKVEQSFNKLPIEFNKQKTSLYKDTVFCSICLGTPYSGARLDSVIRAKSNSNVLSDRIIYTYNASNQVTELKRYNTGMGNSSWVYEHGIYNTYDAKNRLATSYFDMMDYNYFTTIWPKSKVYYQYDTSGNIVLEELRYYFDLDTISNYEIYRDSSVYKNNQLVAVFSYYSCDACLTNYLQYVSYYTYSSDNDTIIEKKYDVQWNYLYHTYTKIFNSSGLLISDERDLNGNSNDQLRTYSYNQFDAIELSLLYTKQGSTYVLHTVDSATYNSFGLLETETNEIIDFSFYKYYYTYNLTNQLIALNRKQKINTTWYDDFMYFFSYPTMNSITDSLIVSYGINPSPNWQYQTSGICYYSYPGSITSINSTDENEYSSVNPNPVTQQSELKVNNPDKSLIYLELLNIKGQMVYSDMTNQTYFIINKEDLHTGIYFYKIYRKKSLIKSGKLMVD